MFHAIGSLLILASALQAGQRPAYPFLEQFDDGAAGRWNTFTGTWEFGDGLVRQTDSAFDCGAAVPVTPDGPFYLSVRFKPESGFNGGGVFFALPETDKKNGGMLVRCDPGGRILWGWFDAGGTFNYYGDVMYDDDGDTEQELAIAVDPDKLAFNIYHHGQRIASNIRTFHTKGFVGIQTSGGPHTITRFETRPATLEQLNGIKPPGPYSRMVNVLGDAHHILALRRAPEFLTLFDADGKRVGGVQSADLPGLDGDDARPTACCWAVHNVWRHRTDETAPADVLVLANEGRSIYKLRNARTSASDGPLVHDDGMRGMGIAVGPKGNIFVADEAIPGIRVFDASGRELLKYGEEGGGLDYGQPSPKAAGKFKQPRGIAVGLDGQIVVLDRGNYAYVVYRYDPDARHLEWVTNSTWLPMLEGVQFDQRGRLLLSGTFEFYRSYGALRVLSSNGLSQRTFVGASLGDMSDKVRACAGPGGMYYLADPDKDRILILPHDFVEPLPRFEWTDDGVELVMTKVDGTTVVSSSDERTADGKRIVVRQSEPVCESWPPIEAADLLAYELPPKPPSGQTYVIDMPVLVAVFAKARDEQGKEWTIDPTGVVDRLQREHARDRRFYWLNSHCLLNKQFEYMVIDDVVAHVNGGWIQPTEARTLVNQARRQRGLPEIDTDHSLVGIHPMEGFEPTDTDDIGYVGGGGLTPYAYSGYALWNHGQAWLMGHEWGHQLDAYFEKSGFTDWWLNHPDGTVHIGRYGEHWDCNAFLCRRADRMNWLRFRFGTLRLVDDRDGDGLPDDDPNLPLDERRFGSSPETADTDRDDLTDFQEAVAGMFTSANPTRTDTDGDGVPDGRDAHPQFDVGHTLPRLPADDGGALSAGALARIGGVHRDWCEAIVFGAYDADHIQLFVGLLKPVRQVFATVDFDNNGWFVGQDNVYAHVDLNWSEDDQPTIRGSGGCVVDVPERFSAPPHLLPYGAPVIRMTIPRPAARPALEPGSAVGLTVRFQNGGGTIAFLIDPWQILSLELE